jgi:hypothetical protein
MIRISRRQFIEKALITAGTLTAFPTILVPKARAGWARKTVVHPNVNNLHVVGITDPRMAKATEPVSSWARQDQLVVPEIVFENIDKLACTLAERRDPEEAWRTIFIKPPRKPWSETVVAIKTNNIALQHTRSAVMAKICCTLTGVLGVKPSNIHIYDGVHGGSMSRSTPFAGLPEGCRIEDRWSGITADTAVPEPWTRRNGKSKCLQHLVEGSVDILVNIAMCKGHSSKFGGFTMTMKNHFGTFEPSPGHRSGALDYLIAINQTPEVLGPMDPRTGKILYPRQQLCIVDALWASEGGPGGYPRDQPNFLAMGVLSPVVDYVVAAQFRGERMGWPPNMEATRRMLAEFGFNESDLPAGGKIREPVS